MQSYIKLYRQIMENEFYFSERFTKTQAWIDLLLLANHKPQTIFIRGNEVNLKRGELGYSIKTLAKRWKWNERTVDKFLSMLSKREMIHHRKTRITTIISIKNYDLYQGNTSQNTSQSMHRIHTDNNDKNDKNKLIELSFLLIETVINKSSVYSLINKYKKELGENKLKEILLDLIKRDKQFENENKLASYLNVCAKNNGHSKHIYDSLPEITGDKPGWMDG